MSEDVVVVGKKHVLVIPARIRKRVGVKEGDLLRIRVEGGSIVLEPVSKDPFRVLAEVIGEPYDEEEDEKRAGKWVRDAGRRH
ncbi:MAG: AbrB/MazE/SpoVT family DNA-binding domain-containing protein [Candidatus Freyrarchaeum guaymaensis]